MDKANAIPDAAPQERCPPSLDRHTLLEPVYSRKYDRGLCRENSVLRGPDARSEFR